MSRVTTVASPKTEVNSQETYYLVWGGDPGYSGIYRQSDHRMVLSSMCDFSPEGWGKIIGSSPAFINKIARERVE